MWRFQNPCAFQIDLFVHQVKWIFIFIIICIGVKPQMHNHFRVVVSTLVDEPGDLGSIHSGGVAFWLTNILIILTSPWCQHCPFGDYKQIFFNINY